MPDKQPDKLKELQQHRERGEGGARGKAKCTRDRQEHLGETVKNALVRHNEKTYFPFDEELPGVGDDFLWKSS